MSGSWGRTARRRFFDAPATRQQRHGEAGFTLIELLVVIAILGVLAAVVAFNITGTRNAANSAACETDLKSTQSAAAAYRNDTGSYATSVAVLVPRYLHSAPTNLGTINMNSDGVGTVTSSECS